MPSCRARTATTPEGASVGSLRKVPRKRTVQSWRAKPRRMWSLRRRSITSWSASSRWKKRASCSEEGSPTYRPYRRSCSSVRKLTGMAASQNSSVSRHPAPDGCPRDFDVAKVGRKRKEFRDDFRDGCTMLIGYARVSTNDQDLSQQRAALQVAGCRRIYEEKVSGAKRDRPQLARLIDQLRADDVVTVTRLDRLARSTRDLLDIAERLQGAGAGLRSLAEPWANTTSPAAWS